MDKVMLLQLLDDADLLRRERDELRARVEQLERLVAELTLDADLEEPGEPGRVWN